jgi:hypothetical protein
VRFVSAGATMLLLRYSAKEALFFSVAWLPKGTVQAAMGAVPLMLTQQRFTGAAAAEGTLGAQYLEWGRLIKASATLAVAIFAAVGTLGIEKLAPVLLEREVRWASSG